MFVFAFTRLSQELYKDVTWFGLWDTIVCLLALWWVWSTTVWLTERLDPDRAITQLVVIVIMFWALVIAIVAARAVYFEPGVFNGLDRALAFAQSLFAAL